MKNQIFFYTDVILDNGFHEHIFSIRNDYFLLNAAILLLLLLIYIFYYLEFLFFIYSFQMLIDFKIYSFVSVYP